MWPHGWPLAAKSTEQVNQFPEFRCGPSCMLRLTVSEVEIRNNNGWGTGDILPDDLLVRSNRPTGSAPSDIISFRPLRRGRLCLRSINRFYINPTNKGRTDVYHQHCRYSRTPGS